MTVTKQAILGKTHYGTNIYAHILRLYYPNETVMKLVGRDCGLCRNPFNNNERTLHIWIEKGRANESRTETSFGLCREQPTLREAKEDVLHTVFDKEQARHEDSTNAIPAGDAFDFAELHYKQTGDELLQTLNKEMFLHIGEKRDFYNRRSHCGQAPQSPAKPANPQSPSFGGVGEASFSFFRAPISNTKPHKAVSLLDAYNYIVGNYAKEKTEKLRVFADSKQARIFKAANFDYCTFSGTFGSRSDKALIQHSGLLCVDFDHLKDVSTLFQRLLNDEYFDTQLLFRSPSGDGLKWIIPIDTTTATHADFFRAIANYIQQTYGVAVDKSGRDISRACFLPHDPQAYIHKSYLK